MKIAFLALVVAVNLEGIFGHGMLMDPVNRGSAWRKQHRTPKLFTDNENFCGGFNKQYGENKGKCGECGDDYSLPRPRRMENGGTYGTGLIVASYKQGQTINVTALLTASHLGHFEFSLCPLSSKDELETEDCFAKHPLYQPNGDFEFRPTNWDAGEHVVSLVLPKDLECEHCVLRWHYRTGNSWGRCPDGTGKLGCGNQEIFRSCSDIAIKKS
ncbi:uncharacterized protein [Prorops nasuta]|uniref:uncharacterized protein n=1 Tax=Prorops nasuta TaxID=863751 RepID=UPI0034CD3E53